MNRPISRRSFLKRSAAAATALAMPVFVPPRSFGANNKITLGCIGVGSRGRANMKVFLALDDCRIVAVCDPFKDRRELAAAMVNKHYGDNGCVSYADWRELIARKDIDAVMIATQDHWHALIATAAAAAGKDMYFEKPMGVSVEEGRKIYDAVRRYNRVFQAGTWQRAQGRFRQACVLVRNGYIGRLREIQVSAPGPQYQPKYNGPLDPQPVPEGFDWKMWLGPAPYKPYNPGRVAWPDWYLIWDYCAGFTCNWGVHHLDIAYWGCPAIGKEPCEIVCKGTYRNKGFSDNIETWHATFTFRSGLRMIFTDQNQQKVGPRFIGENGWIHVDRADPGIWAEPASLLQIRPKPGDDHLYLAAEPGDDVFTIKRRDGDQVGFKTFNHGADFLHCVRTRKDPVSNVEATHVASYLGLIAEIAARLETKLKWDPRRERFIGNDEANARLSRPMHNGWTL
ncbi:MAG: Gfo/Idh/MocA family oxidoreductase [Verrucomicrobiae bacterium]|nr:Gfo/Idh/MocA family oxidoreductase [Verrucomicrobiae bacterium]